MSHLKVTLWPHLLQRVTSGHLLLELLLQLLASADGLLVAGEVGQLLQPSVGEVLWKMLAAPFVGRKEFLRRRRMFTHQWDIGSRNGSTHGPPIFVFLLTISLLSMPTLRRLPATELMSFSLIHDLNSLTAKAAETPGQRWQDRLELLLNTKPPTHEQKRHLSEQLLLN